MHLPHTLCMACWAIARPADGENIVKISLYLYDLALVHILLQIVP
jgi:hypothetical protein